MSQPAIAIPPYRQELIGNLVGARCQVPQLSNPKKFWWVTITEVKFVNDHQVVCCIEADHHKFGHERWVALKDCRWQNHIDDPFVASIVKARGERSLCDEEGNSKPTVATV